MAYFQSRLLFNWKFYIRLREYEVVVDSSTRRGPEVERINFVILEMARKWCLPCAQNSIDCIFMCLNTVMSQHISEHAGIVHNLEIVFSSFIYPPFEFYGCWNIFVAKEHLEYSYICLYHIWCHRACFYIAMRKMVF